MNTPTAQDTKPKPSGRTRADNGSAHPYAGYGALLRLALRRDRIRLPAWVLGISLMTGYFANAIQIAYPEESDLEAITGFMEAPAGLVMSGPGYGVEDPSYPIVFAMIYAVWLMLGAAFMNILLVGRHTRAEEEAGRLELIRANVVGRHAPLAVAATLAVGANLALFLLSWVLLSSGGYPTEGSALMAASIAMVGLVFAGVAAVTGQLTEHSRSATGMASLLVALAMVIRGAGDVLGDAQGQHGSWLSWLSPLGWAQQTRAYYDDRWWPMLLGLAMAVLTAVVAYALQARRDLGAGLVATRLGRPRGSAFLGTPFGLTLRMERASLLAWTIALLLLGYLYGALTDSIADAMDDLSNQLVIDAMGGDASNMIDGYLGTTAMFNAFMVACYALTAAHRLTREENSGRTEVVLAGSVAQVRWMGAALFTALVASTAALLGAGLGMGLGAATVTGDWAYVGSLLGAHLVYLPSIAVVLAIAALGYAVRPGWLNLAWVVAVYSIVIGFLGSMLDLPEWTTDVSPFGNIALVPLEEQETMPLVVLVTVAVVLVAAALVRFRRRDLVTG